MARVDQEIRGRGDELMRGLPETQSEFIRFIEEQNSLNASHFARLEEIVSTRGWPGRSLVGEGGAGAALIILGHSNIDQRKAMLPILREAAGDGRMEASQLAGMEDSILVSEGRNQSYGTFFISDSDGNPELAPVDDPANLDERRKSVGLPSIEEQFKRLEQDFGVPIGRGNLATPEE
jgi:hypothetical protein